MAVCTYRTSPASSRRPVFTVATGAFGRAGSILFLVYGGRTASIAPTRRAMALAPTGRMAFRGHAAAPVTLA